MKTWTAPPRAWLPLAFSAALIAGCAGAGATPAAPAAPGPSPTTSAVVPTPTPEVTIDPDTVHMVVIGDSIPFARHFCSGCTSFATVYARDLQAQFGHPVAVVNRSRDDSAGMQQIEDQVTKEVRLREQIAAAEIVIVSVGFNNVMPDPATGVGCPGDEVMAIEAYVTWLLAAKESCLQAGLDAYAAQYDRIFSAITALRAGEPTVYAAINVHDGNLDSPDFTEATVTDAKQAAVHDWLVAWYDRWNEMLCRKAVEHGFACIDDYHAFNGPNGEIRSQYTVDGAHPSQAGHDLIASLLAELDTSSITR